MAVAGGETIKVVVLTPQKKIFEGAVKALSFPGRDGLLEILPGHTSLVSELGFGVLFFTQGTQAKIIAVESGLVQVEGNTVTVLADCAEEAENIDTGRAQKALTRSRERLAGRAGSSVDIDRAWRAERRALARLEAAAKLGVSGGAR